MDKRKYHELKEMLCDELEKIADKGELSAGSLETVHKLTDTIKNIGKIEMLDGEGEYSEDDGMWTARGTYPRYSRTGHSYRGRMYSRAEGRDALMDKLGEMMSMADEREKDILKKAMRQLENI